MRIARIALEVLGRYRKAPGFKSVLERLRDLCRRGDHLQRSRSIEALTEFRDRFAVDALVGLLGTRPETIAEEARQALVVLTCQDFR
jgi:HEAT repeat protein